MAHRRSSLTLSSSRVSKASMPSFRQSGRLSQWRYRVQQCPDAVRQSEAAGSSRGAGFRDQRRRNQEQNVLFGQAQTQYQEPLNIYNSLMSGAQPQQPSFSQVPQVSQAGTDVAGITNNAFNNQMAAYQQQMAGINNLFGLGGSLGAAAILA